MAMPGFSFIQQPDGDMELVGSTDLLTSKDLGALGGKGRGEIGSGVS